MLNKRDTGADKVSEISGPPVIGFLLYPDFTGLDLFGPHEVLALIGKPVLIAETTKSVRSENGLVITPDTDFASSPPLDIFVIPGGPGCDNVIANPNALDFVRQKVQRTNTVATVCTGALILAASGAVKGRKLTTHWLARHYLSTLGVIPQKERVVVDGKFWSSAGVSAGIDLALSLTAHLTNDETAKTVQLDLEYDPQPPFDAGSPEKAPSHIVNLLRSRWRYPQESPAS